MNPQTLARLERTARKPCPAVAPTHHLALAFLARRPKATPTLRARLALEAQALARMRAAGIRASLALDRMASPKGAF